MIQARPRFLSFTEYLNYDDGTEQLYELFNGELIPVPPESGRNVRIATFLLLKFAAAVGYARVRGQGLELEVQGEPRNRYPDLTILQDEHILQLEQRNTLRLFMSPPLLVVEVASPGELQWERDYIAKRRQYQDRGIPEYWIIDPQIEKVTICCLSNNIYQAQEFTRTETLLSTLFADLSLTVAEILDA